MIEQIRDLLKATDWQPFLVHRTDGQPVPVQHRAQAWVSPYGRFVYEKNHSELEVLRPEQIARVETHSLTFKEIENQTG
ncbi:MAG TPA: hypothetical protein VGD78_15795 [Chthoniobacterales bacterium]